MDLAKTPLPVNGDHERLTEVFANLLNNAAKYTHPGGTIRVRSETEGRRVLVAIRDNGYGIPPDRIEGIFTLFGQVPEHREHTGGGGLGIGLALSRKLVELMGHVVLVVHDGPNALEQVEAFGPQVVLLDVGLPGMDGIGVGKRLRAQPGGDRLILVAITGWGQEDDRQRTREAGFDEHLIKPVDTNEIRRVLEIPPPPDTPAPKDDPGPGNHTAR